MIPTNLNQQTNRLPEPFKSKIRDALLSKVSKFLTIKRPLDCNRAEFFAYAEAFATMGHLDYTNLNGSMVIINALLRNQDTVTAAITMLGKTVEICQEKIFDKCEPATLSEIRQALEMVRLLPPTPKKKKKKKKKIHFFDLHQHFGGKKKKKR